MAYFKANIVDYEAFFRGTPGLSVRQIHEEAELRAAIEDHVDRQSAGNGDWWTQSAADVRRAIQQFVKSQPTLKWAETPPGPPIRQLSWYERVGVGVGVLLLSPLFLIWVTLVRFHEISDESRRKGKEDASGRTRPIAHGPEPAVGEEKKRIEQNILEVTSIEDEIIQNQLSHVVVIKPGWFRLTTLRIVLTIMNLGGDRVYNQGRLFGVSPLHFVRWVIIDEGKRLLFLTNYDGSMISYVGDFVNKSWQIPSALTAIWSNTFGFPRSRWLILEGARDINRFTAFLRGYQVPTQVWYSAYKRSTNGNIMNNARMRRELFSDLNEEETEEWLRRF